MFSSGKHIKHVFISCLNGYHCLQETRCSRDEDGSEMAFHVVKLKECEKREHKELNLLFYRLVRYIFNLTFMNKGAEVTLPLGYLSI